MKAVAVCGSPRKDGNTEFILKRSLNLLEDRGFSTRFFSLGENLVKPCIACGICGKTKDKTCAIKDDSFHSIFSAILEANVFIVGSPVYFGSGTPQTMAFLDRAGYVSRSNGNLLSRKIGGPVVVARRAGHNFTFAQLLMWYMINDFIVPGSNYWSIAFGRLVGEVKNDEEGLKTVDRFTENLAWLSKKVFSE